MLSRSLRALNRSLATATAQHPHHHWRHDVNAHWRDRLNKRWACRPRFGFPWATAGVFAFAGYWFAKRHENEKDRLEEKELARLKREHELAMEEMRLKYTFGAKEPAKIATSAATTPPAKTASAATTQAATVSTPSTSAAIAKEFE